jgi:dihydroneopterin aldolase
MADMMAINLGFEQLKVVCLIGTLPHERQQPQEIKITLKMQIAVDPSFRDEIDATCDYTQLALFCEKIACSAHHALLETLAKRLLEGLYSRFACQKVWIRIEKPSALAEAKSAFVEVCL